MAQIYAGTSGFAYASWKPRFYPAGLPSRRFLEHYATRLNSVEINYTFRQLPSEATLTNWIEATGKAFLFAPKAPQRITHILRLRKTRPATDEFLRVMRRLRAAHRLGPILFQLPPNFRADLARLARFLARLPAKWRWAFEFRHESWLNDEVYEVLAQHGVALCWAESETLQVPEVVTAEFVYRRLRKPAYSARDRRAIAARAARLVEQGKDVFLFFKHENAPQGALYAEELLASRRPGAR